jgi:hypothetical protein
MPTPGSNDMWQLVVSAEFSNSLLRAEYTRMFPLSYVLVFGGFKLSYCDTCSMYSTCTFLKRNKVAVSLWPRKLSHASTQLSHRLLTDKVALQEVWH